MSPTVFSFPVSYKREWFFKAVFTLLITLVLSGSLPGYTMENAMFPKLEAKNLNGEVIRLPEQIPGDKSLLLIAFQKEQQKNLDTWVQGMKLEDGNTPWLELPIIKDLNVFGRWFLDTAMRRGIPKVSVRERVVTLYTDKPAFLKSLDLASEQTVYILVIDRAGQVLARQESDYTTDKAALLLQALR